MAYKFNAREKEIENRLRKDYFSAFDAEEVIGDIDFAVGIPQDELQLFEQEYLLWAEAKKSNHNDIYESLVQLILTIGKARTFDKHLPPAFLGAFDAEKIAFLPYHRIIDVFSLSYIDWTVRPSDHETDTFRTLLSLVKETLEKEALIYSYDIDDKLLRTFIKRNFISGKSKLSKVRINKTNFTSIFQKWLKEVKPTIAVNWEHAKKNGIIAADFYLADILSEHNSTLRDKLYAVLRKDHYELDRKFDESGFFNSKTAEFSDKQKAHTQFWNRYERPPRREYWDEIVKRRDQLVPQDIREIKGSYFTPAKWVSLSQQYLCEELGENWQEEYYIWDCCAGTGNLLANLTNKYRIWASTLDKADVAVMHDRVKTMNDASTNGLGSNLLDNHIFQFDFLNDSFDALPDGLKDIISDSEKRRKLIVYINPPYVEASNARTPVGTGSNRKGVSKSYVKTTYGSRLGRAVNEMFAQFFARIWHEINGCIIAVFSPLKIQQGPNFVNFRAFYRARLSRIFIVPAKTFDNVKGHFPIGFQIWHTSEAEEFKQITADVYERDEKIVGKKNLYANDKGNFIIDWIRKYYDKENIHLAYNRYSGTDFQHSKDTYITLKPYETDIKQVKGNWITAKNIIPMSVYFTVRHVIEATWLNNTDQFLFPNNNWLEDKYFQSDCLIFALFHIKNLVSSSHGINHFIPFTEEEVGAKDNFKSNFMSEYICGRISKEYITSKSGGLFDYNHEPLIFSKEAQNVLDAGRELWRYYHNQPNINTNASFYDIRKYFQKTHKDKKGKEVMNTDSKDECYTLLLKDLRNNYRILSNQIIPKIYEYGFLRKNYESLVDKHSINNTRPDNFPPMDEEAEVAFNNDDSKLQDFTIDEEKDGNNSIININIENHFSGNIETLNINGQ